MCALTVLAPFRVAGEHVAIELAGGRALFTTRRGGASRGPYDSLNLAGHVGDDPDAVAANHLRLAALAGMTPERLVGGRPVHGARVRTVRDADDLDPAARAHDLGPAADAADLDPAADAGGAGFDGTATAVPGVAPLALGADCLPVALIAPGAVAMLHCGWRGLASGILPVGVAAMRELGGERPLAAAIGPGAGRCCYEVGEEVHAAFAAYGPDVRDGRRIDLKLVARRALEKAGADAVHDVELCTICDAERFFSHRRDGLTGRQGGIAWRA